MNNNTHHYYNGRLQVTVEPYGSGLHAVHYDVAAEKYPVDFPEHFGAVLYQRLKALEIPARQYQNKVRTPRRRRLNFPAGEIVTYPIYVDAAVQALLKTIESTGVKSYLKKQGIET